MIDRAHSFAPLRACVTALALIAAGAATADIVLVSRLPGGGASAGGARNPMISADGRWVAFESVDLVASDTDALPDVYLFDAQTLVVQRMSIDPTSGNVSSSGCKLNDLTPNGRFVLMSCGAQGLVPGAPLFTSVLMVFDRDQDADGSFDEVGAVSLTLVSKDDAGAPLYLGSTSGASISDDGRRVAYAHPSNAGALPGCGAPVFLVVHDRDSDSDGILDEAGAFSSFCPTTAIGSDPMISGDGAHIAFESTASLLPGDINNSSDVYRVTLGSGALLLISADLSGQSGSGDAHLIDLSADGDDILFSDFSQPIVLPAGYTPMYSGSPWVLLRDITDGTLQPVSRSAPDAQLGTTFVNPGVAFDLDANGQTALRAGSGLLYLMRRDTVWPPEAVVSGNATDAAMDGTASHFAVATTSALVGNDLNGLGDVYLVSRAPDLRVAVAPVASTYPPTHPGTGPTFTVTLSNEGTFSAPAAMLDLTQAGMQIRQLWFPDPDGEIRGSCDPLGAMVSNTLHCSALLLDPGKTWTITVETNSVAVGTATLTATVVSAPDDVDSDDHVASADVPVVPGADLEPLLGSIPGATVVGNGTSMLLGVINRGTVYTATNARMRLTLPSVIQFDSFGQVNQFSGGCTIAGNVIDCLHAALAPGESVQVQVAYTGTSVGGGTVQMVVSSDVADSDPADNATGVSLSFIPVPPPPPPPAPASGGGGASDLWSLLALLAIAGARRRRLD
jgi:hypothetical protein